MSFPISAALLDAIVLSVVAQEPERNRRIVLQHIAQRHRCRGPGLCLGQIRIRVIAFRLIEEIGRAHV